MDGLLGMRRKGSFRIWAFLYCLLAFFSHLDCYCFSLVLRERLP